MDEDTLIVLPRGLVDRIEGAPGHGRFYMKHLPSENLYVAERIENNRGNISPLVIDKAYKTLIWRAPSIHTGQWCQVSMPDLHITHVALSRRPGACLPYDRFRDNVAGLDDPGNKVGFVLTHWPDMPEELALAGVPRVAGWLVSRDGVQPASVAIEPRELGIMQLAAQWPVSDLSGDTVMVVGLGSIGGAIAEQLAALGVGHTLLVDPDRFLWHNQVRHVLGAGAVGRHKVDAVREYLNQEWPNHNCRPLQLDVVRHAHLIRPLIRDVDLVVCAADGIGPRRVVSHLARNANVPAVLTCVLDDGGIGEILRLRPGPAFGCLLCHRADLAAKGAIDPEADQELAYGTGLVHKPMTAIPTDLHMLGALTAKIAGTTLLEAKHGEPQHLPGDHAVLGLRANLGLQEPYNVEHVGEVAWHPLPPPRDDCYTCTLP